MSSKKRGRQEGGGGKPNKKRYVNKAAGLSSKGGIPSDSRGILVSCTNSKEQLAGREAIAFFTESYEQLGGTWTQQAAPPESDGVPTDFAAALASEVAHLKEQSRQPFSCHSLGLHSIVYVECKDREGPSPAALVAHACERVAAARQAHTRHCSRFYPVEHTCYASLDKVAELAEQVVAQHFPADAEQGVEFAVVYDARAGPQLDRMDVINAFATRVPKPHKVNLGAPQKAILVNVVKAQCGVAVVERFKELCRFNIRTLALPEEEREAQREAQRHATRDKSGPDKAAEEQQAQGLDGSRAAGRQEGKEQQAGEAQEAGQEQQGGRPSAA